MIKWIVWFPFWLLLLSGCTSFNSRDVETLESLNRVEIIINHDAIVEGNRDDAIVHYETLKGFAVENQYRADALRRLADLTFERGETREMDEEQPLVPADIVEYQSAIEFYEELLQSYGDNKNSDRVLYQLSRVYEKLGRLDDSIATLTRLVENYPQSDLLAEAQFRRGEFFFTERRHREAVPAYAAVVAAGESSDFYQAALLKQGWTLFKLDRFDAALGAFFRLLDLKLADLELSPIPGQALSLSSGDSELVNDALNAVTLIFSYSDDLKLMATRLEERGARNYDALLYFGLGDLYLERDRYQNSIDTYRQYRELYATSASAPFFQLKIIDIYHKRLLTSRLLAAKEAFVTEYSAAGSYWVAYDERVRAALLPELKVHLTELTSYYHVIAQKEKTDSRYREAERWYRLYLSALPVDAEMPRINFLLAELLFESKRYAEAAVAYERTAYDYPEHERGSEAAYAALLAHSTRGELLKLAQSPEIDVWREQQTTSVLRFIGRYPNDARVNAILSDTAVELFKTGSHGLALQLAQQLLASEPPSNREQQRVAWSIVAHINFTAANYAAAEEGYREGLALTEKGSVQAKELVDWLAATIYKQAEQSAASGDNNRAIEHFLRIAIVAPASAVRVQAEYDAATLALKTKQWMRASAILEQFRLDHSDHELQKDVAHKLSLAYMESGRLSLAAAEYELIAKGSESDDIRSEAAWQAAQLYEKIDHIESARRTYKSYIKAFPQPLARAMEARHRLSVIYSKLDQFSDRDYWLRRIIEADAEAGSERSNRTRYLAAHASLTLAEPSYTEFQKVKLVVPLATTLKLKQRYMQEALKAYSQAAEYEVADVVTAATHRIGEIYYQLSSTLMESERPADLNELELEQYEILLEEQAYPFEEQAIEYLQANTTHVTDGLYDEWIKRSFVKLAELLPVRYAKEELGEEVIDALH